MTRSADILEILDEFVKDELRRFVFYLTRSPPEGFQSIPRGKVHQKSKEVVVDEMIEKYGEQDAPVVTIKILQKMKYNNLANKLQKRTKLDSNAVPLKKQRLANAPSQTCQPTEEEDDEGNQTKSDEGKDALAPVGFSSLL